MSSDALSIHIEHFFWENCVGKLRKKGEILCVKKLSCSGEKSILINKCKFACKNESLESPMFRESSDSFWVNYLHFKYANTFFPRPSFCNKIRHFQQRFSSQAMPLGGAVMERRGPREATRGHGGLQTTTRGRQRRWCAIRDHGEGRGICCQCDTGKQKTTQHDPRQIRFSSF